jgi:5-methylcytosine-specific restriction enzyme subunit McrC
VVTSDALLKDVFIDSTGIGRFLTIPDAVMDEWIIDTKWKRLKGCIEDPKHGIAESDVCQMMAYAELYGRRKIMLLYPHHDGLRQEAGRIADFTMNTDRKASLVIGTVDLSRIESVPAQLERLVSPEPSELRTAPGPEIQAPAYLN